MSSLTVSFWMQSDDSNCNNDSSKAIFSLGEYGENLSTNVFEIEFENNQLQVETETGNEAENHEFTIDNPLPEGIWYYLIFIFDNDTIKYYKNGELINSQEYTPAETTANDLFLGAFDGSDYFYKGKIDDIRIFKCVLSESEIQDYFVEEVNISDNKIEHNIKVYPNPVYNILTLESNTNEISPIRIFDISGKLVMTANITGFQKEIDVSTLPQSVYFIQIITAEKIITQKFVKLSL